MKAKAIALCISFVMIISSFAIGQTDKDKSTKVLHMLFKRDVKRELDKNTVYLEVAGSAYGYSINYERLVFKSKIMGIFGRAGLEYIPLRRMDKIVHFPVAANILWGKKRHTFETGIGGLFRVDFSGQAMGEGFLLTNPATRVFLTPVAGYRFMSKKDSYDNAYLMRVTFTPLLGMNTLTDMPSFIPWFGISVGKTW